MPIARSTLAGISTGVVLLAAAAGFGIGLPKVIDAPTTAGDLPVLPDQLDDTMIEASEALSRAVSMTSNPEFQESLRQSSGEVGRADAAAIDSLTEVYGGAAVRSYYSIDAIEESLSEGGGSGSDPAEVTVAVVPGGGVVSLTQGARPLQTVEYSYEQRLVDGHPCSVTALMVDRATGAPVMGDIPAGNYVVQCRAERNGLSYVVDAKALLPEQVAAYLDVVLDETA